MGVATLGWEVSQLCMYFVEGVGRRVVWSRCGKWIENAIMAARLGGIC